jgi:hypothetical protein
MTRSTLFPRPPAGLSETVLRTPEYPFEVWTSYLPCAPSLSKDYQRLGLIKTLFRG